MHTDPPGHPRPDSSAGSSEERPVLNREAAGSTPARGSTWHYIVVRKELAGGAALAQVAHAAGESAALWALSRAAQAVFEVRPVEHGQSWSVIVRTDTIGRRLDEHRLPDDTRLVVLGATKEQMTRLLDDLLRENVPHKGIVETDGPLTGMVTALGLVTTDRELLRPFLGELRPYRP